MNPRKKLENDIRQWLDSRLIGNEVYETVISWIDRQAEITAQVYGDWIDATSELQAKVEELTKERNELRSKIDIFGEEIYNGGTIEDWYRNYLIAHARAEKAEDALADVEKTHMRLPVDADGVPIAPGDTVEVIDSGYRFIVIRAGFYKGGWGVNGYRPDKLRHVKPDTVESLLEEFHGKLWSDDEEQMALLEEYAERIRKVCNG